MNDDELMARLYWRLKREPEDGTLYPAIRVHSQACGLIAYLFDVHPDVVAKAVADFEKHREANRVPA